MAVNQPSPRAKPEDKHVVINPWQLCFNFYISHLMIGPDCGACDRVSNPT